jgi:hypothetical protein
MCFQNNNTLIYAYWNLEKARSKVYGSWASVSASFSTSTTAHRGSGSSSGRGGGGDAGIKHSHHRPSYYDTAHLVTLLRYMYSYYIIRSMHLPSPLSPPFTPTSHHTASHHITSHHITIMYHITSQSSHISSQYHITCITSRHITIASLSRHRQCEHGPEGFYMLSGRPHRQRQEDSHAGHSVRSGQVRYRHHYRGAPCSHSLATSHLYARIYYPQPTPNTPLLTLPYSSHLSFSILLLSPLPSFPPSLPSMQGCQASARSRPHIRQHERDYLSPAGHSAGREAGRRNGRYRRVREEEGRGKER